MKLNQFIQKFPNSLFIRFFFDVEYDFGVTKHACAYMKYEQGKMNKSVQNFYRLFDIWAIGQMDNKRVVRGYDRVFTTSQLKQQLNNCSKFNVQNEEGQYYFVEVI